MLHVVDWHIGICRLNLIPAGERQLVVLNHKAGLGRQRTVNTRARGTCGFSRGVPDPFLCIYVTYMNLSPSRDDNVADIHMCVYAKLILFITTT